MSRWIEKLPDGGYKEEIADKNLCRWLIDEVCCNDKSELCADWPDIKLDCEDCPYFEEETDETD